MTNYKESSTTGTKWRRCETVTIRNTLNTVPCILFVEEDVAQIANTVMHNHVGVLVKEFSPTNTIQLLDPSSGEPTGDTLSHGELYTILYSLYIQTARERDTQAQV